MYAGLRRAPWGDFFYVAGPVFDDQGRRIGVILVGKSLQTLVRQIRRDTLAQTTIYDFDGQPIVSTLVSDQENLERFGPAQAQQIIERQDSDALIRPLTVASVAYSEILGPWEVRDGADLGIIGASLAQTFKVGKLYQDL